MFNNLGEKLKTTAFVLAVLDVIGTFIVCIFALYNMMGWIAFIYLLSGLLGFVMTWPIYALGELVIQSEDTNNRMSHLEEVIHALNASNKAPEAAPITTREVPVSLIPVGNYYANLPVKVLDLLLRYPQEGQPEIAIRLYSYMDGFPQAVLGEVSLTTIWDEEIRLSDLGFLFTSGNGKTRVSNWQKANLTIGGAEAVKEVCVRINRYIVEGRSILNDSPGKEILIPKEELKALRARYGVDLVCDKTDGNIDWTCICGNVNSSDLEKCQLCNRIKGMSTGPVEKLLTDLEQLNNAKEMYQLLCDRTEFADDQVVQTLTGELKNVAEFERLYGNAKKEALKQIKMARETLGV